MNDAAVDVPRTDAAAAERRPVATVAFGAFRWFVPLGVLGLALAYAAIRNGALSAADWNVALVLVGVAALIYSLLARQDDRAPAMDSWLAWLVALAPAYVAFQLVPLPSFLVQIASPGRAQLLDALGTVMPDPRAAPLSINPAATLSALVGVLGFAVTFLLVRDLAWRFRRDSPWAMVVPLLAIGVFESGWGVVQAANRMAVRGTYEHANGFAGLLAMVLPLAVASGIAIVRTRRGWRRPSVGRPIVFICAAAASTVLLIGAVAASGSGVGFIAAGCALLAMAALPLLTLLEPRAKWALFAGLAAALLIIVVALPANRRATSTPVGGPVSARGQTGRVPLWRDTLRFIGDYPLTGSGLGTYGSAFQKYQTSDLQFSFAFAQNDYLQLLAELGLLGAPLFIGLIVTAHVRATRAATLADADWNRRLLGLGCVGAIAAIGAQGLMDFSTHIPANAFMLAWIAGLAVTTNPREGTEQPTAGWSRNWLAAAAVAIVVLGSTRLVFATAFKDNVDVGRQFCRIGICDASTLAAAARRESPGSAAVSVLLEALWQDPADPSRWCDLGEAMVEARDVPTARTSFSHALALGPNVPPIHLRAARFYFDLGDTPQALAQASQVLQETRGFDDRVFDLYVHSNVPVASVLAAGLPDGPRAPRRYLRSLIAGDLAADAATAWDWLVARGYASDVDAREFVHFLFARGDYGPAAHTWAQYMGDRATGYLQSSWIFDGGFENRNAGTEFDWKLGNLGDSVLASIDPAVARSGKQSLKIRFGGEDNVDYHHTSQTVFVTPGTYQFSAYVRALDVTTDQGVGFHIFDAGGTQQIDLRTPPVTGTTSWTRIEQQVTVPDGVNLLTVEIARTKSLLFDSHIRGTLWVDDVSLTKVE